MSLRAVLMYHSIDDSGSPISIAPKVFAEHLDWMSQSGMRVVSLGELVAMDRGGSRDTIALTFDDGFASFNGAARLLEAHGFPATVFVVTGHVGRTNAWRGRAQNGIPTMPLLDWTELERLCERGFTVGAHTHTHTALTTLSRSGVEAEMDRCAVELQTRLGTMPRSLAYPFGYVNAAIAALASARYPIAVTTEFASWTGGTSCAWVPRLDTYYFRRPGAIRRLGARGFDRWANWVRFRRQARQILTARDRISGVSPEVDVHLGTEPRDLRTKTEKTQC